MAIIWGIVKAKALKQFWRVICMELSPDKVKFKVLDNGRKGVAIGDDDLFLEVKRKGKAFRFKLIDLFNGEALTPSKGLPTLDDFEHSKRLSIIRDQIKHRYENFDRIFEKILIEIEDHLQEFTEEKKTVDVGEQVEEEIKRLGIVQIHPVIDYYNKIGLLYGVYLQDLRQTLIFTAENVFKTENGKLELPNNPAISISVRKVRFVDIQPRCLKEMLSIVREIFKGNKIENPSFSKVFSDVFYIIHIYWYHSDPRVYLLFTCWIIGTYFFPIFDAYPILVFQGERESGKSTALWLIWLLAWNPTNPEGALRGADLFRTIESSRQTYLVDITTLSRKAPGYWDVIDTIELGYEKGGVIKRCHPETNKPLKFEVYSPKAVATRSDLPFLPKCIRVITNPTREAKYVEVRDRLKQEPKAPIITNMLLRAGLTYHQKVKEAYDSIRQTDKLKGRRFRLWKPLLAICKVFAPDKYNEMLSLAEEDAVTFTVTDEIAEVEDTVLSILLNNEGETKTMLLKTITNSVKNRLPWVKSWQLVKTALSNLGVVKRFYKTSEGKKLEIDLKKVREKAEKRGILQTVKKNPALTQENIQKVFEVLTKLCKEKGMATLQEIVMDAKISEETARDVLGELQSIGKAIQFRPDIWKVTT